MRELLVFRQQVFRHLAQDWLDVIDRAGTLWSPRWRDTHFRQSSHLSNQSNSYHSNLDSSSSLLSSSHGKLQQQHEHGHGDNVDNTNKDHNKDNNKGKYDKNDNEEDEEIATMVIVDEENIVELWLPGSLLHLFSYRYVLPLCCIPIFLV